jgi:hypothetical protein
MRRAPIVAGLVVLVVGFAAMASGYLTRERDRLTVTPQPPAVEAPRTLALPGRGQACMNLVALDRRSEEARIRPTMEGRAVPLEITISGEGYRARGRAAPDYRSGAIVGLPVKPPSRSLVATVCIHNLGRRAVALAAVVDRRRSRSAVTVNGTPAAPGFVIQFAERRPVSVLHRLPDSVQRMAVLRPGWVGSATLWVLLVLFVAGVPALSLWAFARAARADEPPPPASEAEAQ